MNNLLLDLNTIAPLWIVAVSAAVVLLLSVTGGYKKPAPATNTHLVLISLAALAVAAYLLWHFEEPRTAFSGALVVDGVGVTFGITVLMGAFISIVLATGYLREHALSHGEYLSLILLSTVGMLILSLAGDLLVLFIGIETMSLAIYVLAGYKRSSRRSQEAALKYFVFGAFASGFALFGIALLYGEVGRLAGTPSLAFTDITSVFEQHQISALGWTGVAMVTGGLAFKIAAVPFHMWAPDVYEGAPTPSAGFMAVGVKTAAFAGLCRFVYATFLKGTDGTETAVLIFEILAIITMIYGNLLAIRQTQIKRMLAYSSIAHAGYLLVGITALIANPQSGAIESIAYYLFGYTAMTLGAFGIVLAFEKREERQLDLSINMLNGIGHRYPALGLAMAIFMFSLAGIPPTVGFFGKLAIFTSAVHASRIFAVLLAVLASAVGAYYYLRIIVVMYMQNTSSDQKRIFSTWLTAGLWICVVITLGFGVLPNYYFHFAKRVLAGWLG